MLLVFWKVKPLASWRVYSPNSWSGSGTGWRVCLGSDDHQIVNDYFERQVPQTDEWAMSLLKAHLVHRSSRWSRQNHGQNHPGQSRATCALGEASIRALVAHGDFFCRSQQWCLTVTKIWSRRTTDFFFFLFQASVSNSGNKSLHIWIADTVRLRRS